MTLGRTNVAKQKQKTEIYVFPPFMWFHIPVWGKQLFLCSIEKSKTKKTSGNPGCDFFPMPYVWSIYALIRHLFMVPSTNQLSPEKHEKSHFHSVTTYLTATVTSARYVKQKMKTNYGKSGNCSNSPLGSKNIHWRRVFNF